MTLLKKGDKAPSFQLMDQNGKHVSLKNFKGKKLLLYFYPKADTSGCTKQACSVRDAMPDLKSLGVAAMGISPDKPGKQKKFDEKYSLGFPLLSDEDNSVAKEYGAWGEKKMYGKTYEGILPERISRRGTKIHSADCGTVTIGHRMYSTRIETKLHLL